jgi:hypothetical protein
MAAKVVVALAQFRCILPMSYKAVPRWLGQVERGNAIHVLRRCLWWVRFDARERI